MKTTTTNTKLTATFLKTLATSQHHQKAKHTKNFDLRKKNMSSHIWLFFFYYYFA